MIALSWPAWILVVCIAASFVCIVIGAALAGSAFSRFSKHLKLTSIDAEGLFDPQRTEANLARINRLLNEIPFFVERVQAARSSLDASFKTLRLPEAMLALRAARAAVRLLLSGR